jgi:hypothetical protein
LDQVLKFTRVAGARVAGLRCADWLHVCDARCHAFAMVLCVRKSGCRFLIAAKRS